MIGSTRMYFVTLKGAVGVADKHRGKGYGRQLMILSNI